MHVEMARRAIHFCAVKFQRSVALTAIDHLVLTRKREARSVVVERNGVCIDCPAIGRMAGGTVDLQSGAVR